MPTTNIPAVLVFSGLDPSGGAGIQADIEALSSHGCHTCPVITALTEQDTVDIKNIYPVAVDKIIAQAQTVLDDIPIAAIKIGLLGNVALIYELRKLIDSYADIPIILDPILATGAGTRLADTRFISVLAQELLPATNILTPNHLEAQTIAAVLGNSSKDLRSCADTLLALECEYVLITGGHLDANEIVNTLYHLHQEEEAFRWKRLPGQFHGSGCTLAASIAGLIAQNHSPLSAILQAQEYTWESLEHAYQAGKGQLIPNRLYWTQDSC